MITLTRDDWHAAVWDAKLLFGTKLVCLCVADLLRWPSGPQPQTVAVAELARRCRLSPHTTKVHVRRAAARGLYGLAIVHGDGRAELVPALPPDEMPPPAKPRLITLRWGDPRWSAWTTHDATLPETRHLASEAQRLRAVYRVPAEWPPESAAVAPAQLEGHWHIPAGTPEHAAWIAYLRHEVRASVVARYESDPKGFLQRSRWPRLMPKHMGASVGGSRP